MAKRDYRQITKDPIIDMMRTEAQREGFIKGGGQATSLEKNNISTLATNAGVSDSTIRNWFFGDTKRPQSFTTRLVLEALGVSVRYVRADGSVIRQKALLK